MEYKHDLDPLQQRTLYAFSIALIQIVTGFTIEEADNLLQNKNMSDLQEAIKRISESASEVSRFTKQQVTEIDSILALIQRGDRSAVLELDQISRRYSQISTYFTQARRYFLKKIEWTVRSRDQNSQREERNLSDSWENTEEELLSAINITFSYIQDSSRNPLEPSSKFRSSIEEKQENIGREDLHKATTKIEAHEGYELETPCYVYAEVSKRVIVNRAVTLAVTISGKEIELYTSYEVSSGVAQVDAKESLLIEVVPTSNFTVVDKKDSRIEFSPPNPNDQSEFYCDIKATHVGKGEVLVIVSQRNLPLLTLTLQVEIVSNQASMRASILREKSIVGNVPGDDRKNIANGSVSNLPSYDDFPNRLTIRQAVNGNIITYEYFLDSRELETFEFYSLEIPMNNDLESFIDGIYQNIESRWVSNLDDEDSFIAELRAYGASLFDELLPYRLREDLWEHRNSITNILIISNAPLIPWELLHFRHPRQAGMPKETLFFGQMGLVRWVYTNLPPKQIRIRPGRAAYVIPDYPSEQYRLPQAQEESRYLEKTFNALPIEPKSKSVRQSLEAGSFDLLHFAGHGKADLNSIGEAKLMMEGRMEKQRYIRRLSICYYSQYVFSA